MSESITTTIQKMEYGSLNGEIKRTMRRSARDIVQVGFMLRMMMDKKLWVEEYSSFDEYLEKELHIDYSMANRFMGINKKYSLFGNSMEIAEKYNDYSQGLLVEMLSMTPEQEAKVTPDMTVKQAREIKKQDKKQKPAPVMASVVPVPEKEAVVIDGEFREVKEPEKVATSQYAKPSEHEREYLNSFARKFIECERDWLIKDYANRVLDVTKSPVEIKNHLGENNRTWWFKFGTEVAHINLFDDYIQVWDGNGACLGDFEWFYLAAAIQSMWNVTAVENAVKNRQIEETSKKDEIEQHENQDPIPEDDIAVTRYILKQEQEKLDDILKVDKVEKLPEMVVLRQKTIVGALAAMVCDLESADIAPEEPEQPELPVLKNNDQRKDWLKDYKSWGLWYRDEHIGAEFYKYDFADGTRLIAETYPASYEASAFYHLVGGPKIRKTTGKYGKYPHHDVYNRYPDSVTEIVEFLKVVQKGEN